MYSLLRSVEMAAQYELISSAESLEVRRWLIKRNMLVHTKEQIKPDEAEEITHGIMKMVRKIRTKKMQR
jgi:hypothetical protein